MTASLRPEYASLLGWTVGLVIEILTQIDAADAKIGMAGSALSW